MPRIVGIIPARYESSRFPGKPLIDLKGKSMIQRVYEGASTCSLLDEVIVATDDDRIVQEVKRFGGKVMMTSANHKSGTERCGELANYIQSDVIINIQGDEPLVDPKQLAELVSAFNDPQVKIATLGICMVSAEDLVNPNRIKVVCDNQMNALYFSRSKVPSDSHASGIKAEEYPYMRHIGLYAYRSSVLRELINLEPCLLEKIESLEQLRWLYYNYPIRVIETHIETPNIDVPEDLDKVLKLL